MVIDGEPSHEIWVLMPVIRSSSSASQAGIRGMVGTDGAGLSQNEGRLIEGAQDLRGWMYAHLLETRAGLTTPVEGVGACVTSSRTTQVEPSGLRR